MLNAGCDKNHGEKATKTQSNPIGDRYRAKR